MRYFQYLMFFLLLLSACSKDESKMTTDGKDDPIKIPIETRLQAIINEKVGNDQDKLVGVSVSIRIKGVERWRLVGGLSKLSVPITENMRFGIGSITKTVVAATILKLEEEGLLSLEDTIGDHVTLNLPNVDETVTILQLLTHYSGINGYFTDILWARVESELDSPLTPREVADYIMEPTNAPGLEHEYSNSNYLVLGLIIEAVTQKTVGEVMREKFWTPLQLNAIYFGSNEPIMGPIAVPWRDSDGNGLLEDISDEFRAAYHSVFYCAAGIHATASDLSMWAEHLYNGTAISESAKAKMLTSYAEIPDPTFIGYGLGVRKNVYASRVMWGHTGGMRGYGSHMFYDPKDKVSIAILNNQSRSADGPVLRHELIEELLTEVLKEL